MAKPSWEGRTLGGRYQIGELLGHGGMSSVYRAFDPNLKRDVAVKIIHTHLSDQPDFVERFEREAASVAQLRHPNIIQVHDFSHEDNIYYIVFEYIAGENLQDRLKRLSATNQYMPLSEVKKVIISLANALDYAHGKGIVHRDIKPANVMLNDDNEPILMDFGITKIIGGGKQTATGITLGTVQYMSPEQIKGLPVDARTDIYALGITLFEMLGGRSPFEANSTMAVMMMHVQSPVPDPRVIRNNIPPVFVDILNKAMAKEPQERYQRALDMARDMRWTQDEMMPLDATIVDYGGFTKATDADRTLLDIENFAPVGVDGSKGVQEGGRVGVRPVQQRKWLWPVVGLFFILLIGGGLFLSGVFAGDDDGEVVEETAVPVPVAGVAVTETVTVISAPTQTPTFTNTPSPTPTNTNTPTATPIPVTATPAARRQIAINNAGFEENFTDWRSTANAYIVQDGHSGLAAVVSYVEGGISDIRRQLPMVFVVGKVYKASVWCKADLGEQCRLFFGDATEDLNPPAYQNQAVAVSEGTGEWQQLSVVVPMSQDEYMSVYLYSRVAGDVLYDDLTIEEVACENICDGGFEEGLIFWRSTENTEVSAGRTGQGIRVLNDGVRSDVIQLLPGIFPSGSTYKATAWCRAMVGDECRLFFGDASEGFSPPAYESASEHVVMGNGDWQQLEVTITLEQDERLFIYLYSKTVDSSVIYDDVHVELMELP